MSDYLIRLANHPASRSIVKTIGLPTPQSLRRGTGPYVAQPFAKRSVLLGAVAGGFAGAGAKSAIEAMGGSVDESAASSLSDDSKFDALVFDATGLTGAAGLKSLYEFFHPTVRKLAAGGRIVVLAQLPETAPDVMSRTAARAVEGFTRSIAKEIGKRGSTGNLIYVQKGAEKLVEGPLRFLLSDRSTYVDGQALYVTKAKKAPSKIEYVKPLDGKTALVTGAARGIGAATAQRLADEGAHVICLDIPGDGEVLEETAKRVGGTALSLDITGAETPAKIVEVVKERGGVDIVVHNAGVTRDKTIANMKEKFWDMVLAINLEAILRVDEALIAADAINEHGRIVCLSSVGGIAGNMGQTNYGATKAGLIGYVAAQSEELAGKGIAINAVAPGFIETRMTAEMPFVIREGGRRLNSLSQGGQPEDVAELITFLSTPGCAGLNGTVIRVCGQSLIGA